MVTWSIERPQELKQCKANGVSATAARPNDPNVAHAARSHSSRPHDVGGPEESNCPNNPRSQSQSPRAKQALHARRSAETPVPGRRLSEQTRLILQNEQRVWSSNRRVPKTDGLFDSGEFYDGRHLGFSEHDSLQKAGSRQDRLKRAGSRHHKSGRVNGLEQEAFHAQTNNRQGHCGAKDRQSKDKAIWLSNRRWHRGGSRPETTDWHFRVEKTDQSHAGFERACCKTSE